MGFLPVGGGGGPREFCPEGAHVAYCHGWWYIGAQRNKWDPDQVKEQVMGVYEIDARDSKGRRFLVYTRETASFNERANLRTKVANVLIPESFAWSDGEWASADVVRLRNEVPATPLAGPCLVAIRGNKSGEGTHLSAIQALPPGKDPIVPEADFSEEAPYVVALVRGEIEGKEANGLVSYTPEKFIEPQAVNQSEANRQAAQVAQQVAEATDGEAYPSDWDEDNPPL